MHIFSFNVNGIRARIHQLSQLIDKYHPDIIGLQETKVQDLEFPEQEIKNLGYDFIKHGQKGHYGVAILYRTPLTKAVKGFAHDNEDSQKRLIQAEFTYKGKPLHIFNGYFPQGEKQSHPTKFPAKRKFYKDLTAKLNSDFDTDADQVLIMGDMNVAPNDIDIGIGEDNRKRWLKSGKCCFLPEEREWYENLLKWGLHDSYRAKYPTKDDIFSWFDYRSRGFERDPRRGLRIDHLLISNCLVSACMQSEIDYDIRAMTKPSDHCPVWLKFA